MGFKATNLHACALFVLATSPTIDNTKLSGMGSEGALDESNLYHSVLLL